MTAGATTEGTYVLWIEVVLLRVLTDEADMTAKPCIRVTFDANSPLLRHGREKCNASLKGSRRPSVPIATPAEGHLIGLSPHQPS
jgi:hypothetical protein